jgi:hypothetical protein
MENSVGVRLVISMISMIIHEFRVPGGAEYRTAAEYSENGSSGYIRMEKKYELMHLFFGVDTSKPYVGNFTDWET